MIENFDWNQFIFFPEDSSNEEYLCVDNNVVNTPIGDRAFLGCHIHILHTNALYENKFKKIFPNAHIVCDIV